MSILTSFLGISSCSNSLIGCSWMAFLTPAMIVMRGFTCHHLALSACMSGLYLAASSIWAVFRIWHWGGGLFVWVHVMHNMSSLSVAKHVHGRMGHVHLSSHCGTMMSWGLE